MRGMEEFMVTWSRGDLKDWAKSTMRRNYWRMVLVGFIMMLVSGGFSGGSSSTMTSIQNSITRNSNTSTSSDSQQMQRELQDTVKGIRNNMTSSDIAVAGGILVVVFIVLLVVFVISTVLSFFLIQPLMVGGQRFFSRSLMEDAQLNEITYAFSHNYMNVVKNMFLMNVFTALWSLLFVIPGIVKSYEYRMIPYLLGEHPEMSTKELFDASRQMMRGQKWSAFVLDISFVGWNILGLMTCGILFIFWVYPYIWLTNAALYHELSRIDLRYGPQNTAQGAYAGSGFGQNGTYNQGNPYDKNSSYSQGASYGRDGNDSRNTPYGQDYYTKSDTESSDNGNV